MNVLILPAGRAQASRRLVLEFQALLCEVGESNPRIDRGPPRQGAAAGLQRSALADTVESYQGVVQVFIRCLDEEGPLADQSPSNLLARRLTFWGGDAWHSLAHWIREAHEAPSWGAGVAKDLEWVVRDAKRGEAASLIDIAGPEWVARNGRRSMNDAEEQRRLQAQVAALVGSLHGGDPDRAEQASARVRDVLARKHGR